MISSVENGDDHTHSAFWHHPLKKWNTTSFFQWEHEKTDKYQVWVLQTSGDRYNGTALFKQGPGIFYSTPPLSFPSPCLSPLYPITSHSLPSIFSPHTYHLSLHTPFLQNLSDPPSQYLRSVGTIVQFLSVRSWSALGVVPERWSAQWQIHWGDTARCCRGALLPWLCCWGTVAKSTSTSSM